MAALAPSSLLAAVASPRRQEILRLVWDGERSAGDIHAAMPDVSFGAVSLQLKSLVSAGLHRQTWDMRYAGATEFPGMIMWAASSRGPQAPPGTYQVRVNGYLSGGPFELVVERIF